MAIPLFLPKRFVKSYLSRRRAVQTLREHPGRKVGKPAGSWIDDCVALRKVIVLCWACQPKFNHKRHSYYKDQRFPYVQGKCTGCRTYAIQAKIYIHESTVADQGRRIRSGLVWTPV